MSYIQGRVQRCDNGNGIFATLADNFGNIASTDVYGLFYSYLAYNGYRLTASAGGYNSVDHFVTQNEVDTGWVTICLTAAPPPPTCFTGDTIVLMSDGSECPIARVKEDDLVLGCNGRVNRVTTIEMPILGSRKLYSINGSLPFITSEHPLWCETGWHAIDPSATALENPSLEVLPLHVGDKLMVAKSVAVLAGGGGGLEPVMETIGLHSLEFITSDPALKLYNLLLDGDHTYFANGFLAHNKGGLY